MTKVPQTSNSRHKGTHERSRVTSHGWLHLNMRSWFTFFLVPLIVFLACHLITTPTRAAPGPPLLISQPTSTRAIALESLCFTSEPFGVTSACAWGADRQTRVTLFALNLKLQAGEGPAAVTADVEDANHQHHSLTVEYVAPLPHQEWLTAVVVKLKDELQAAGDVLVQVSYNGAVSNRVRLGIGYIGGGPADDPGSGPTLAPPYIVSGRIARPDGQPVAGVTLNLAGADVDSAVTASDGSYTLIANKVGDYTISPLTTPYFSFVPQALAYVHQNQIANFTGVLRFYRINGRLSIASVPASGVAISLSGSQAGQTTTNASGDYSFTLPAGGDYTIAPSLAFHDFQPAAVVSNNLTADQSGLNFSGARRTYSISGRLTGQSGAPLPGIVLSLTGGQQGTTTTDANGNYQFNGLPADYDFNVAPITTPYYTFPSQTFSHLLANQNADFAGTLRYYTLRGYVRFGPNNASNFTIQITGSQTTSVTTDINGNYAVSLPAGGNYRLTPLLTYYSFAPANQVVSDLTSDQNLGLFNGTRDTFTINGKLLNQEGTPLVGLTVNLAGAPEPQTTVTDGSGRYEFPDLYAGHDYTVTPVSTAVYVFAARTFADLRSNQTFDFTGLRRLVLSGTVKDSAGNGLPGVKIRLAGTDNSAATTASDGSYSLIATSTGNYSLTPSIGQNWYLFTPGSQQINNLSAPQAIDFTATLAPIPAIAKVLEFDGQPKTVDYGNFWLPGSDLGHFFWEFWAMPGPNAGATYMLSDGYGGAHALLFGVGSFGSSETGRYELLGNLFDGVRFDNYFGSDVGPAIGEWAHIGVGWDGHNIITYYNGVPVGKTPFVGPRLTPGPGGGGGRLLIGGSDHSNFSGRIAEVRGYEAANPREATGVETAFAPQTVFSVGGNLLSYYFREGTTVADLSHGYNGTAHEGVLRGTTAGILFECSACPPPQFVVDPSAPNFATGAPQSQLSVPLPLDPPPEALVFDSFSRANSTYTFGGLGGLGSTESGSAGPKVWQTNQPADSPQPFGILNTRAVLLGNSNALAWVASAAANGNMEVQVGRRPGRWGSGVHTGLSFRVLDANNFFFAYTTDAANQTGKVLHVGYYQYGVRVELTSDTPITSQWFTLRVVTATSGSINVFLDSLPVFSANDSWLAWATGAGLYSDGAGKGLVNRWDNFGVFAAPQDTVATQAGTKRRGHSASK